MEKIKLMLFFTRDFCKECDNEDFYNKLLNNNIKTKDLKEFLTHSDIGDLNSIIDKQINNQTGFKNFEYDFTKIKSIKLPTIRSTVKGVRVDVETEVKKVKREKSPLESFLGF